MWIWGRRAGPLPPGPHRGPRQADSGSPGGQADRSSRRCGRPDSDPELRWTARSPVEHLSSTGCMGQNRRDRTWLRPRFTRFVWIAQPRPAGAARPGPRAGLAAAELPVVGPGRHRPHRRRRPPRGHAGLGRGSPAASPNGDAARSARRAAGVGQWRSSPGKLVAGKPLHGGFTEVREAAGPAPMRLAAVHHRLTEDIGRQHHRGGHPAPERSPRHSPHPRSMAPLWPVPGLEGGSGPQLVRTCGRSRGPPDLCTPRFPARDVLSLEEVVGHAAEVDLPGS